MQIKSGKEDAVNYVRWIRNSALGVEIKWGMLFNRGVTKHFLSSHFDNFPFLWEWGGWGSRRPCSRLTVSVTCLLFKAVRCFQPEKKKKENPQLFLFHPSWAVCPFAVAMTTASLLLLHLDLFPNGEQWMQKIRKWERQVGIKGIRIIYPGEENAKRWQLQCSGLLKVTTTEVVPCSGPR